MNEVESPLILLMLVVGLILISACVGIITALIHVCKILLKAHKNLIHKNKINNKIGNIIESGEFSKWTYKNYFNSLQHNKKENIELNFLKKNNENINIILLFDQKHPHDITSYTQRKQHSFFLVFRFLSDKAKSNPILDKNKLMSTSIIDSIYFNIISYLRFSTEIKLENNLIHFFFKFELGLYFLKKDFFVCISHLLDNYIFKRNWHDLFIYNALTQLPYKDKNNMQPLLRNAKQKYALLLELGQSIQGMSSLIEKEIHHSELYADSTEFCGRYS